MAPRHGRVVVTRPQLDEAFARREQDERAILIERPCVHCFRPTPARPGIRVICEKCRDVEASLNGPARPAVQPAYGVTRPPGEQPLWTPAEDRVLMACRTATEGAGRLPWRSKTACHYRLKTLRKRGRVRPYHHRPWTAAEDEIVIAAVTGAEVRQAAERLGRALTACWRRRSELRRAGADVTTLGRGRPPTIRPRSARSAA